MGASENGFQRFAAELRAWWPILAAVVTAAVVGVAAAAATMNKVDDHEVRLDAVERIQREDSVRLKVIEVQTGATAGTVEKIERKVDRLLERD